MPSQTFLNLAEEKKQRIFNAIYAELKRVPFPEMSINQVIKNAGIPRGSFYQYFENKDDAFDYFVTECSQKTKECIMKRVTTARGDIFDVACTIFEEVVKASEEQFRFEMINHIMPYIDVRKIDPFSNYVAQMEQKQKLEAYSSLGIGNLNIKNEQELMDIVEIIEAIFQSLIPKILLRKEKKEDIVSDFNRKLNIIRKATVREAV